MHDFECCRLILQKHEAIQVHTFHHWARCQWNIQIRKVLWIPGATGCICTMNIKKKSLWLHSCNPWGFSFWHKGWKMVVICRVTWASAVDYQRCTTNNTPERERETESIRLQIINCRHMYWRVVDEDFLEMMTDRQMLIHDSLTLFSHSTLSTSG